MWWIPPKQFDILWIIFHLLIKVLHYLENLSRRHLPRASNFSSARINQQKEWIKLTKWIIAAIIKHRVREMKIYVQKLSSIMILTRKVEDVGLSHFYYTSVFAVFQCSLKTFHELITPCNGITHVWFPFWKLNIERKN